MFEIRPPDPEQLSRSTPNWIKAISAVAALLMSIATMIYVFNQLRGEDVTATPDASTSVRDPGESDTPGEGATAHQPQVVVVPLTTISVPGRLANGVQFTAAQSGTYRFEYVGGAYAVYVPGTEPAGFRPWLTAICVFKGDKAPFDGEVLRKDQAIIRIADIAYAATEQDAINMATGGSWFEAELIKDQIITLVGVDHLYSYGDNPGAVEIKISYVTRS